MKNRNMMKAKKRVGFSIMAATFMRSGRRLALHPDDLSASNMLTGTAPTRKHTMNTRNPLVAALSTLAILAMLAAPGLAVAGAKNEMIVLDFTNGDTIPADVNGDNCSSVQRCK